MEIDMSYSVLFGLLLSTLPLGTKGSCALANVAVDKPSYQSSTYINAWGPSAPEKAVDGNTDGYFSDSRTCSHTNTENNPYWKVDLGAIYTIEYIRIYNREDCCFERLSMVEITVSPNSSFVENQMFAYIPGVIVQSMTIYPDNNIPMSGQWVQVMLNQMTDLVMCEVEVYAQSWIKKMDYVPGQGGEGRQRHIKTVPLGTLVQAIEDCRKCDDDFSITVLETYMEYDCAI